MSDVPLGLFLSGGIDSSGARRPDGAHGEGAGSARSRWASPSARPTSWPTRAWPRARSGPSTARSSCRPTSSSRRCRASSGTRTSRSRSPRACRSTSSRAWPREHVKVVLTGEGADELFLGYNRYRVTAWNERLGGALRGAGARRRCARGVRRACRRAARARSAATRRAASSRSSPGPRGAVLRELRGVPERAAQRELLADRARRRRARSRTRAGSRCYDEAPGGAARPHEPRRSADLPGRAPDEAGPDEHGGLDREPRAVPRPRARGARGRACPGRFKLRGWQTKAVLREALARRGAAGDPHAAARWASRCRVGPLAARAVLAARRRARARAARARARGLFDAGRARGASPRSTARAPRDHGDRLWLLVNLEIWQRVFLDGEDAARRDGGGVSRCASSG